MAAKWAGGGGGGEQTICCLDFLLLSCTTAWISYSTQRTHAATYRSVTVWNTCCNLSECDSLKHMLQPIGVWQSETHAATYRSVTVWNTCCNLSECDSLKHMLQPIGVWPSETHAATYRSVTIWNRTRPIVPVQNQQTRELISARNTSDIITTTKTWLGYGKSHLPCE